MSDLAIRVEGVSKRYPLLGRRQRAYSLRDALASIMRPSWWTAPGERGELWALRDVGLEVRAGEVIGVVGRNGSGKSTLLKVLSRIVEPTTGRVEIWGRVASLLEVGTGFHSELSGRQNIFLSGAILGMRRAEIERKLDQIVAFAEVEEFVDTPVKFYSSGMYMRLGFAVAAHLDADILLVDEVLAVGDAAFQKRCLGRMSEVVRDEGRTVVFVSHNLQAVATMCTRGLLLERGNVRRVGPVADVIAEYLGQGDDHGAEVSYPEEGAAPGTEFVRLRAVRVRDAQGALRAVFGLEEPVRVEAEARVRRGTRLVANVQIVNEEGILVLTTHDATDEWGTRELEPGVYRLGFTIPGDLLNEGMHGITLRLTRNVNGGASDVVMRDVLSFRMRDSGRGRGDWTGRWAGAVRPVLAWTGERVAEGEAARG